MILGVDQSLTGTGLALLSDDRKRVKTGVIVTKPTQKWSERFKSIIDGLDLFLTGYSEVMGEAIRGIAMESYAFSSKRAFALGEVGGVIKWHLVQKGYEVHSFIPAHHKMFVARHGDATKQQVKVALVKRFGINVTNHNAADAVSIALLLSTALDYGDGVCEVSDYDKQLFERMGIFRGRTNIELGIGKPTGSRPQEKRKVEPAKDYTRGPGEFASIDEFERYCKDK